MNAQHTQAETQNASSHSTTRSAAGSSKGFRKFLLIGVLLAAGTLGGTALLGLANATASSDRWAFVSGAAATTEGQAAETPTRRLNRHIDNGVPVHAFRWR